MLFAVVTVLFLSVIVWLMPTYLRRKEMLIIWVTASYLEIVIDYYLGYVLSLYKFLGDAAISPWAFTIKLFMSPLFALLFLNFMPKKKSSFLPYWLAWVIVATIYEGLTITFGYLTYTGWKIWYSAIFYLFIFWALRKFYFYIK